MTMIIIDESFLKFSNHLVHKTKNSKNSPSEPNVMSSNHLFCIYYHARQRKTSFDILEAETKNIWHFCFKINKKLILNHISSLRTFCQSTNCFSLKWIKQLQQIVKSPYGNNKLWTYSTFGLNCDSRTRTSTEVKWKEKEEQHAYAAAWLKLPAGVCSYQVWQTNDGRTEETLCSASVWGHICSEHTLKGFDTCCYQLIKWYGS